MQRFVPDSGWRSRHAVSQLRHCHTVNININNNNNVSMSTAQNKPSSAALTAVQTNRSLVLQQKSAEERTHSECYITLNWKYFKCLKLIQTAKTLETVKVKTIQVMVEKKQKISMFLNENRRQAKLLRTCRQLADCSISNCRLPERHGHQQ